MVESNHMNFIVLVKQVPDISRIPQDAWDKEKGTLKRSVLDAVLNPLDLKALTLAVKLRVSFPEGKIICLTMGPRQAKDVLLDCLSRGADEAVLLTDVKFAGADTPATAAALAQAIRKIRQDFFKSDDYIILSGMQSVDGDTAQVPPQVAEDLGIDHIGYVRSFSLDGGIPAFQRIISSGIESVSPLKYPLLLTVVDIPDPVFRSFKFARKALVYKIIEWNAESIKADPSKIGAKGSKTWVSQIYPVLSQSSRHCFFPSSVSELLDRLHADFRRAGPLAASGQDGPVPALDKTSYTGDIWVYIEHVEGQIAPVSLELLTKAKALAASLKARVAAVVLGQMPLPVQHSLGEYGADIVYSVDHPYLHSFRPVPYKYALKILLEKFRPQIMLFGATLLGRELAPRAAYAIGAGLTADCTALELFDHERNGVKYFGVLKQIRPALGGNIMAAILTKDAFCQMATVRPGVFRMTRIPGWQKPEIIQERLSFDGELILSRILAVQPEPPAADLSAEILVSGGHGLGTKENFNQYLPSLAAALSAWLQVRAEVVGSRTAVEDGFITHDRQIGQTGHTVTPKLYVAVGISGAIQHIAGMQHSAIVLAVNTDKSSRILGTADYALTMDYKQAVPQLVSAIEARIVERQRSGGA